MKKKMIFTLVASAFLVSAHAGEEQSVATTIANDAGKAVPLNTNVSGASSPVSTQMAQEKVAEPAKQDGIDIERLNTFPVPAAGRVGRSR